ncbi:MAG: Rne/Rng family ribonuclease [Planctomycetota bacterium]
MTDHHSVDALAGVDPLRPTSLLPLRPAGALPAWTPPGDSHDEGASDPSDAAVSPSAFGAGIEGSGGASSDDAPAKKKKPARKRRARKTKASRAADSAEDAPAEDAPAAGSSAQDAGSDPEKGSRGMDAQTAPDGGRDRDGDDESDDEGGGRKRRRRGSRGGRRRKRQTGDAAVAVDVIPGEDDDLEGARDTEPLREGDSESRSDGDEPEGGRKKRRRRRSRRKSSGAGEGDDSSDADADADLASDDASSEDADDGGGRGAKKKRKRSRSKKKSASAPAAKTAEEKAAEAEAMRTQTIAVNAVEPEERRVAVFDGERIVDFLMTAESQKTLVNDIYRGRVVNLEPAIGAAFIDFGQGRNGFLHTSDVLPIYGEDGFEITDLLTAGHHDEEGDHDADWAEEADALDGDGDEEHDDEPEEDSAEDADGDSAEEASDEAPEDAEADEEGDDDDDDEAPTPRGRRSLRSRSRRPASSMVASLDDAEGDSGSGGDDGGGDSGSSASSGKKRSTKRKRSRKKAAASDADGAAADDAPKKTSKKKASRKKASRKKATASKAKEKTSKKASKKSSKKKRSSKAPRSRTSRSRGRGERRPQRERRPIDALLKVGDPVVVQVTKDAIGDKGPTLTTYISMPGRYLVLMPSMSRTGVSRKIPDEKERKRLKRILASLKTPTDMGVIVRTAGVGRTKTDLQRDLDYLLGLWESFGKKLKSSRGPAPLYLESDVSTRTLRDLFNRSTKEVVVDDLGVYEQMVGFAEQLMPEHVGRIKKHEGDRPLFQHVGIEQDFERIFARRVDLPSGGSIVFDQAEALVAIDVNSGRTRTDSYDFEDIALKTNLEAVPEIARQIRLRDLGGIIVCDFIDMMRSSSNRQVERALRTALADDRARSKLGRISQFGLLEMTRQRLGPGTHKKVFQACPRCRGTGRIRTVESRAQAILRRLGGAVVQKGFTKVEVRAHPEVVQYLKEDLWDWVRALEHRSEKQIDLTAVPDQPEDSVLRYLRADGREVRPGGRRKR